MDDLIKRIMKEYDIPSFHICNYIIEANEFKENMGEASIKFVGIVSKKISNDIVKLSEVISLIEGLSDEYSIAIRNIIYDNKKICEYFCSKRVENIERNYRRCKMNYGDIALEKFFTTIDPKFSLNNKKHAPWSK